MNETVEVFFYLPTKVIFSGHANWVNYIDDAVFSRALEFTSKNAINTWAFSPDLINFDITDKNWESLVAMLEEEL